MARAAGLTVEAMIGLTYNPITKHYRLVEGDVSVNYMIRASKPRELRRVFDAFVFDLDGTLVDTASELIAAYQNFALSSAAAKSPSMMHGN